MQNSIQQRSKNFLCLILLLQLSIVSSCTYKGSIEDRNAIEKTWSTYYSPNVSQQEKNNLLTEEYKLDYVRKINSAIRDSESDLKLMKFEDKLNILIKRYTIDSLQLADNQLNTFEKAFNLVETTSSILMDTDQGLSEILFTDKETAYGVFNILFSNKSNQFVKENGIWKINPTKEHHKFIEARDLLKQQYIKQYGSCDGAIEGIIHLTTGKDAIWQPLRS